MGYNNDMHVSIDEINSSIYATKSGKSGGPDRLSAECFKYASDKILVHRSCCYGYAGSWFYS